jgi:LCP family protein required for cell wall assembly
MERNQKRRDEMSEEAKKSLFSRREKKSKTNASNNSNRDKSQLANENYQYNADNQAQAADLDKTKQYEKNAQELGATTFDKQQQKQQKKLEKKRLKKQRKQMGGHKKRHPVRIIIGILILLVAFGVGTFAYGKSQAEKDTSIPKAESETFNGVASSDGSENILLLGSDTRTTETGRADTMMVINLSGSKPKIVSFMRDMYVTIPGYGDNKLNAAYAYGGAELVRQTLSSCFGVECKYYAMVDFQSFEKVIDALFTNGVKIDAEKDLDLDGVSIKKGEQMMDGHTLLQYARFRHDTEGDFGRVRRQQQVMTAIFSQIKNPWNLLHGTYAAGKVFGYTSTNLPTSYLLKNTLNIAKGVKGIDRLTAPVDGSWEYGDTANAGSVLFTDEDANKTAIAKFLAE